MFRSIACDRARCASLLMRDLVDDRLVVRGEVDAFTAATFSMYLADAIFDRNVDVIDLSGVTFFDSRGVAVLERFELHRQRRVIGSAPIAKVLRILGRSTLLTEHADAA